MKLLNLLLSTVLSFFLGFTVISAAEVDDVPLEEQLEMLQMRLWEAMTSTDISSIKEFQELLETIAQKEKELERYNATDKAETMVAKVEPQASVTTPDTPAQQLAHIAAQKRIVVDKSKYQLTLYEGDKPVTTQRVIVGRKGRSTPSFTSKITHVVVNPYWNVSRKIATVDLAPKFWNEPKSVIEQGFQVFESWRDDAPELDPLSIDWTQYNVNNQIPYLIRQKPGPENGVGQIKFMVEYTSKETQGIILHGSPLSKKSLFDTEVREYSSGCVRVEDEIHLAKLLLNNGNGYTDERIQAIVDSGRTKWIKVRNPVELQIL